LADEDDLWEAAFPLVGGEVGEVAAEEAAEGCGGIVWFRRGRDLLALRNIEYDGRGHEG
jgi:hypothetical protein